MFVEKKEEKHWHFSSEDLEIEADSSHQTDVT